MASENGSLPSLIAWKPNRPSAQRRMASENGSRSRKDLSVVPLRGAQRRMASENGSQHLSGSNVPKTVCSTPDGV